MTEEKLELSVLRKKFSDQIISIEELERRMRPGMFSEGGFLGEKESLIDVLCEDAMKLQELDITYSQLADRLEELIIAVIKIPDYQTARVGNYLIQKTVYEGWQICPWTIDMRSGKCEASEGHMYASIDWVIKNIKTGKEMSGPGFIIHLIREHHFFEGFNSPYRVDVQNLAQLLDLI